jgi:hypothetical protein
MENKVKHLILFSQSIWIEDCDFHTILLIEQCNEWNGCIWIRGWEKITIGHEYHNKKQGRREKKRNEKKRDDITTIGNKWKLKRTFLLFEQETHVGLLQSQQLVFDDVYPH